MARLAREFRGLTQTAVADRGGPSQTRLSRIEAGTLPASGEDLAALSRVLEFPAEFFRDPGTPAAAPLFRKRAIRSTKKLATIQARLNTSVLIAKRLLDAGIEIDPPNLFPEPGGFASDAPYEAAAALRRDWRLPNGRIEDVTTVIENAGGVVLRVDFGSDDASAAFLTLPDDARMWFLVNVREESGDRVRLSLSHELGHAVLHRLLPSVDEGETEEQAFSFAVAFLLPPDHFDRQIPFDALTLTKARALKAQFGVSIAAIVRTAYERKRISRARYTSLYKQISARQWRKREPDPLPVERSHIWPVSLAVHREEHGYTEHDLADIAHVDVELLGELFPEDFRRRPRLRPVAVTSAS